MSDELEHRLRRDLEALDDVVVGDGRAIEVASDAAADRIVRSRRRTVVGVSATVVAAGAFGLWATRSDRDEVSMTDVSPGVTGTVAADQPSSTSPATPSTTTTTETSTKGAWHPIAADPRGVVLYPSVVWTGDEALVVGGRDLDGRSVRGAAAYSPDTDSWRIVADPPETAERVNPLTAWTGSEMLMLGGDLPDGSLLVSYGSAYNPATDAWRVTASPPGFVNGRSPWVWTGVELYVWPWDAGGSTTRVTPLAYDPATDVWRELPEPPVARRQQAASVWTGTEWLVWGGTNAGVELADGVAYDPSTDTWRVLAESPLSPRRVRAVWTGSEMIVDAGSSGGDPTTGNGELAHGDGAAYDPATDTWRTITPGPGHPGFEPVWTGSSVLMFAKGDVVVYDVATDRWVGTCCNDGGGAGGVGGPPVWTGIAALIIGSTEPGAGGVTFKPPTIGAAAPTSPDEAAVTATTVATQFPGADRLEAALTDVGVDIASAPAAAVTLGNAELCGVEQRSLSVQPYRDVDDEARRCLLDHHMAAQPAVFVEVFPTTEGDPIVTVWRTLADGTVEQFVDSTRDSFGSGEWDSITCGRLTTMFPQASEPPPPAHFSCDSASIDVLAGRLAAPAAAMPAWFEQRTTLPVCGYEIRIEDRDLPRRECFADAVAAGSPAEYAVVSTGDEGERSARWFRSLGNDAFEVIEWQSPDAFGSPGGWFLHSCSAIAFADEPNAETDGLPLLNANGECSTVTPGTIAGQVG